MIGFYVHHHGLGHQTRALLIAAQLHRPVIGFSTLARPDGWPGEWIRLEPDDQGTITDPTASGLWHWAPLRHRGHASRLAAIAQVLPELDAMVVDTSVEVTMLARLFGVPTVLVALRGTRTDRPHRAGFDAATAIVAPWPQAVPEPSWPSEWAAKTTYLGGMSRFDARPRSDGGQVGRESPVLVLLGGGGSDVDPEQVGVQLTGAVPGSPVVVRTPQSPAPDLWAELQAARVVVTHAGNGALGDVAAARVPAVVVAQDRPFDEQRSSVAALRRLECAVGLDQWPDADQWPDVCASAIALGGANWSRWSTGRGAELAARTIEQVVGAP